MIDDLQSRFEYPRARSTPVQEAAWRKRKSTAI
jgi:hypothetical protein